MEAALHANAVTQLAELINQEDELIKRSFKNVHQGYPAETLVRFLKARDWNVSKAHKMLADCLNWRIQNEIDDILSKAIIPTDLYGGIRDSQLIGLSGYSKEGLPVFALGVGLSTYDKASPEVTEKHGRHISTCLKVLDMTGLKLSALSQLKLLTQISTVDDLNYPEKTETYYIVNAPYVFSACWKVVKPLLQEKTRKKVQVLHGCGRDELLEIMDYTSLPHFCKRKTSAMDNCFSLEHPFHQEHYSYMKNQAVSRELLVPRTQGSVHVDIPEPDPIDVEIVKTIESEFHKIGNQENHSLSLTRLNIGIE